MNTLHGHTCEPCSEVSSLPEQTPLRTSAHNVTPTANVTMDTWSDNNKMMCRDAQMENAVGNMQSTSPISDSEVSGYNIIRAPRTLNLPLCNRLAELTHIFSPKELERIQRVLVKYGAKFMPQPYEDELRNQRLSARHLISTAPEGQDFDGFYFVDLGKLVLQMAEWKKHLPQVRPFYAMKCNPNSAILDMVSAMGAGFDCASLPEFMTVLDGEIAGPEDIIFANPCKQIKHMQKACSMGLEYVTFDNAEELRKISKHWPNAKCVLRIITNDAASVCQFSTKFGAPIPTCVALLELARELEVNVVGVSFHVGSGCGDAMAFVESARNARAIFDEGAKLGFDMTLLDIGGGFPGEEHANPSFADICAVLRPYLEANFSGTRIIAEPGRFFACATHTLVVNVFAKRVIEVPMKDGSPLTEYQYYVNDGVYGSFNCIFFDHAHPDVHTLEERENGCNTSTIFGPTCDSLDCIMKRQPFPEVSVGDWLVVPNFGAYTSAAAGTFNGFRTSRIEYVSCLPVEEAAP